MHWIVLGCSPSAPRYFRQVQAEHPGATVITCNAGWRIATPDVYFVYDRVACAQYRDQCIRMHSLGVHLVTLARHPQALRERQIEWFDEYLHLEPVTPEKTVFTKGNYPQCNLSGLFCLCYAINNGASHVHVVGMEGYTHHQNNGVAYFDGRRGNGSGKLITERLIEPITQSIVDNAGVLFSFYGNLAYSVTGTNVERINGVCEDTTEMAGVET